MVPTRPMSDILRASVGWGFSLPDDVRPPETRRLPKDTPISIPDGPRRETDRVDRPSTQMSLLLWESSIVAEGFVVLFRISVPELHSSGVTDLTETEVKQGRVLKIVSTLSRSFVNPKNRLTSPGIGTV